MKQVFAMFARIMAISAMFGTSILATSSQAAVTPRILAPQTFQVGLNSVRRVAFSHDGRRVAFLGYADGGGVSRNFGVAIFNVASRRLEQRIAFTTAVPRLLEGGLAFSPDDTKLAAGADMITIWDTRTWAQDKQILGPFERGPYKAVGLLDLAFTPRGDEIIAIFDRVWSPYQIRVADAADLNLLSEARLHSYRKFGRPIVYQAPEIEALNVGTGKRLTTFYAVPVFDRGDHAFVTSRMTLAEDGKSVLVAVMEQDGKVMPGQTSTLPRVTITRTDLQQGQVTAVVEKRQQDRFTAATANADQSVFATGEEVGDKISTFNSEGASKTHLTNDPIRIWGADGSLKAELGPLTGAVRQLLFLPGGKGLLACLTDPQSHNPMTVWDLKSKTIAAVLHVETARQTLIACALSEDGQTAILTIPTGEAFGNGGPDTAYLVDLTPAAK